MVSSQVRFLCLLCDFESPICELLMKRTHLPKQLFLLRSFSKHYLSKFNVYIGRFNHIFNTCVNEAYPLSNKEKCGLIILII